MKKSQFRQFLLSLFLLLLLIVIGTSGYRFIEGWSLRDSFYMTFITISTVGYGEIHPLTPMGQNFTIAFLIFSVFTIGYTLTRLLTFIFEGQIVQTMKERRMKRLLSITKDHIIICGFGDIGREVAEEFTRNKIKFVVVDRELSETDAERYSEILFIQGDAADEETLKNAKIERAKGVVACLPDDQQNVFVVLTARQMNPNLQIVTKASDERNVVKFTKAGADKIISPKQIAGRRLAAMSSHPSIVNFLEVLSSGGDESLRIESVKLEAESPLINTSLKQSNIGSYTGAIIIGILGPDGRTRMNQSSLATLSSLILSEGDELIALGSEEQLERLVTFAEG